MPNYVQILSQKKEGLENIVVLNSLQFIVTFFLFFFSFYCSGPQGIKHHLTFFSGMSKGVSSNRVLANSLPLQLSNVILPDLSLLFSA